MTNPLRALVLPREISDFERHYLERVNRVAFIFLTLHLPVLAVVAWLNDTRPLVAIALSLGVLVGPFVARTMLDNPRTISIVSGVSAMFMGGLLVHFGQGPVQIEMHFYFFALVAMCAVFGNPLVIVAAAATVALHHLVVWSLLPRSVFNYDAAWWVVAVHAGFVVLESIAACFISRSFFDNVIGLERIVRARTAALDGKNRDMRMLLDHVQQGFLTIDRAGVIMSERSAAVDAWFGAPSPSVTWFDYLAPISSDFSALTTLGWDEVRDGVMPSEVSLAQMPRRFATKGSEYSVSYRAIGPEPHEHFLVIVTDITNDLKREQADMESREAMALFERALTDRSGLETFFDEGAVIVASLRSSASGVDVKRMIHTLKGNAGIMGLHSIAKICHALEDYMTSEQVVPPMAIVQPLVERWTRLGADVEKLTGTGTGVIQIDDVTYRALLDAATTGPKETLVARVEALRLESTKKRLGYFAEQARRISRRLEKGDVDVRVEDNDVRLDPKQWGSFWNAFIHALRNAVDHGIELPRARLAAGKPERGVISLKTATSEDELVIEIVDDGKGIDWSAVADRAKALGLPARTPDEVQKALFADGLTTATRLTEISGRGVGMGALMQTTKALGGSLSVESAGGKGTSVRMTFPRRLVMGSAA